MSGHVASARVWIDNAVNAQASTNPNNEQLATAYAGIGQVYATLALVEQQRIANLIALFTIENRDAADFATAGFSYPAALGEIVEALGLS